ncbi:nucleotide sugar dehydrogenase [bacterium]|nr:nucleotide sugar dehydrogenase [bacterium]
MSHHRIISVIGLGYVGLPVAVAFAKQSLTIGFDVNTNRLAELRKWKDRTGEVSREELENSNILFTDKIEDLKKADFHIVAVPTPINSAKQPDLTPLFKASKTVGQALKQGDIVVYESTVYPGATEEECVPILESISGLKCGKDFKVGYSPERINPGDKKHTFTKILKVVSGQDEDTLNIVADVYGSVVEAGVYKAASIKVAEAAKVIENTQRDLNIAFVNELSLLFDRMNIDTLDVLAAAATKWNFLPFKPGLVGGHCIGVDPYYLTYKAEMIGYSPQVILSGRKVNDRMGSYIAQRAVKEMIFTGRQILGSTATILGITFKENCPDIRNSKVIDIIEELEDFGVNVQVHDCYADKDETRQEYNINLVSLDSLPAADALIIAVSHQEYLDKLPVLIPKLVRANGIIIDVKGIVDNELRSKISELGFRLWRL